MSCSDEELVFDGSSSRHPIPREATGGKSSPPLVEVQNLDRICRLCLELDEHETYQSIFAKDNLVDHIQQSIGIEIEHNEDYPYKICQTCIERVDYIHRSRELFHKNDQFLRTILENEKIAAAERLHQADTDQSISTKEIVDLAEDDIRPDLIVPDLISVSGSEVFIKQEAYLDPESVIFDQIEAEEVTPEQMDMEGNELDPEWGCSSSLTTKRKTKKNAKKISKVPRRRTIQYFCNKCGREFDTKEKLRAHMKYHIGFLTWVNMGPMGKNDESTGSNLIKEMAAAFNGSQKQPSTPDTAAVVKSEME